MSKEIQLQDASAELDLANDNLGHIAKIEKMIEEVKSINYRDTLPEDLLEKLKEMPDPIIAGQVIALYILKNITSLISNETKEEDPDAEAKDSYGPAGFKN